MNKLITSLACCTVLSMTLMGASYASPASVTGMGGTTQGKMDTNDGITNNGTVNNPLGNDNRMTTPDGNMMNGTTGTMNRNNRGDDYRISPLTTAGPNGNYRARATTGATNNGNDNGANWGWLGLVGLLGLAGMRNRSTGDRR
ncbi:hypothetical protein GCM10010912_55710 [Paenibacillus albidus]|uniref:WGxxGxxG-CTERM domain-containing protein n=1 Tax=Paenibacillus albidus TaxID=2041023 RepID=A0A917FV15_9BACL|nr:WGxxGxxG family protein [Paenibacillus albidus]GGG03804.1 hypothetical protein GCM10010912_55710 [Paenibacillus albidus]